MPKSKQLPEEVASHVREQIMSGEVKAGDFLRMEPIAEALGVSITPVREGLLALSNEGFVELMPRRGFVVSEFSRQDVHDLFWAQAQLAAELAARAVTRATPADVDALQESLDAHRAAVPDGRESAIAVIGRDFHGHINKVADSPHLTRLLRGFLGQLPHTFYVTIEGHHDSTIADHEDIVAAFRDGDTDAARAIMERHILDGAERLVEDLAARGLWSNQADEARSA